MTGVVVQHQGLIEIEDEPGSTCAGGCQARMPPLPHADFELEHVCEEADGGAARRLDGRTSLGIAAMVAKNSALGVATVAPGIGVLALLAAISRGAGRAPLLCAACTAEVGVQFSSCFFGGLMGLYGIARAETVLLEAPLSLVAGAMVVPAALPAYFRWAPHAEFVNRQYAAAVLTLFAVIAWKCCLLRGSQEALDQCSGRPRHPWWQRTPLATSLTYSISLNIMYFAPQALTLLAASVARFWLLHECKNSDFKHYALILGFQAWQVGATTLMNRFLEEAAASGGSALPDFAGVEEKKMGAIKVAKTRAVLASGWTFPMALAGKLLVTALQSWQEALIMSGLNLVIEIAETVSALRAAETALPPLKETQGLLRAVQAELPDDLPPALQEGLSEWSERVAQQQRKLANSATKILGEQLAEYAVMTAVVAASLVFSGHPLVDGFSNGQWSSGDALRLLLAQFLPELICDFTCLAYLWTRGVDIITLHSKVHMCPEMLAYHSANFVVWLALAALAAQKRSWGA